MTNLYTLTNAYLQLQMMIEEGADEALLQDTIESVQEGIKDKVEGYTRIIRNIESDVAALKEEEKRLAERRRGLERSVERLKGNLFDSLKLADMKQVKGSIATVSIRKTPPKLEVSEDAVIDMEFYDVVSTLRKKDLLQYIKQGNEVEGVQLVSSEALSIR